MEIGATMAAGSIAGEDAAMLQRKTNRRRATPDRDESIGERIARLRKDRELTQVELAERLGIVQPLLSRYESGRLQLPVQLAAPLACALGVTADQLLGLERAQPPRQGTTIRPRWRRRLEQIERLPTRKREALVSLIEAFLAGGQGTRGAGR